MSTLARVASMCRNSAKKCGPRSWLKAKEEIHTRAKTFFSTAYGTYWRLVATLPPQAFLLIILEGGWFERNIRKGEAASKANESLFAGQSCLGEGEGKRAGKESKLVDNCCCHCGIHQIQGPHALFHAVDSPTLCSTTK